MRSMLWKCFTTNYFRFVADYRPFYTIHDADFKELTSSNSSALPAIILGVTNPFFNKVNIAWRRYSTY